MTFTVYQSFLSDPDVWIADLAAATVHNTPYTVWMTCLRDAAQSNTITMGNGPYEHAAKIAEIGGVICNKHGEEQGCGVLTKVTLLPTGKYNLFSLTCMIKAGWKLNGNANSIYITQDEARIDFDIGIPTLKGVLFAMYLKRDSEIAGAGANVKVKMPQPHDMLGRPLWKRYDKKES